MSQTPARIDNDDLVPAGLLRPVRAPRHALNPGFVSTVWRSGYSPRTLTAVGGFSHKTNLYAALRDDTRLAATPRMRQRLARLADAVGFPRTDIFLDGNTQ